MLTWSQPMGSRSSASVGTGIILINSCTPKTVLELHKLRGEVWLLHAYNNLGLGFSAGTDMSHTCNWIHSWQAGQHASLPDLFPRDV